MLYVNYIFFFKKRRAGSGGAGWTPVVEIFEYKVRGILTLSLT